MEKLKFVGRDKEIQQLKDFLQDEEKLVFLVGGRVGIGKTRLLEELTDSFIYGNDYLYPFKINPDETSENFLFRIFKSLKKEHESFWTGDKDKWRQAIKEIPAVGDLIDALISKEDKKSFGLKFVDTLAYFTRNTKKDDRLIFVLDPEKNMHNDLKDSLITIWNNVPQEVKERVKFIIAQRPEDKLISDADFLNYYYVESFKDKLDFILIEDSKHIIESSAIANKLSSEQIEFLSKRCQGWPLALDAAIRMLERSSDIDKSIKELPEEPMRIIEALYEKVTEPDAKEILYYLALIPDFIELPELETIIKKDEFTTEFIYDMLHKKEVSALLDFEEVEEEGEPLEKAKIFHPFFSEMLESEMQKKRIYPAKCKNMADYYYQLWKKNEKDIIALENIPLFYLKAGEEREYMEKVSEISEAKYRLFLLDSLLNDSHKALEISKDLKDKKYESTFLNNIGLVYKSKGEYDKALKYYDDALGIRIRILGKEDPSNASLFNNIGSIFEMKGVYDKALEFYKKSLNLTLKAFGEMNSDIAIIYNNIGTIYHRKGDFVEALNQHNKSLNLRLNLFGENHADTGSSYNNIGAAYESIGKYDKAKENYRKSLIIRIKIYGKAHPDVATSLNNIAGLYNRYKKYNKALKLYCTSLDIMIKFYGYTHPDIATTYNNIALLYSDKKEYDKAFQFIQKSLDLRLEIFGKDHPDTASSYINMSKVYFSIGDLEKSMGYAIKGYEIFKKCLGLNHPYTYNALKIINLIKNKLK